MSKYTEAAKLIIEEHRQDRCWTEESFEAAQKIEEACRIADRLERADVNRAIGNYEPHLLKPIELVWFANGYNQALKDIRGDNDA